MPVPGTAGCGEVMLVTGPFDWGTCDRAAVVLTRLAHPSGLLEDHRSMHGLCFCGIFAVPLQGRGLAFIVDSAGLKTILGVNQRVNGG
jgi:hypothetical protein